MKDIFNNRLFVAVIISIFTYGISTAQSVILPKTIIVEHHAAHGLCTNYLVDKGNTVYSIAKAYQVEVLDIIESNPKKNLVNLQLNDRITIPVNHNFIDDFTVGGDPRDKIPVYYKAKKGDNLFRISRIYFDLSIEDVKKFNKMSNISLQPNQLVLVGYKMKKNPSVIKTQTESTTRKQGNESKKVTTKEATDSGSKKQEIAKSSSVNKQKDTSLKSNEPGKMKFDKIIAKSDNDENEEVTADEPEAPVKKVRKDNGIAVWNPQSLATGIFALHRDAIPGSQIEVYNPFSKKSLSVTVIGEIPATAYADNVKIIISPETAKALGALDERFYVKMSYVR
ncbi:MAG TPA: LysM peptidoglycan-binding domain-containing protein [Saprospiraceae bacterium]|nr:hypothetical protein [Saprospirales bacterium]HRQ30062.1 LysM peptidoglycan-binding domain-containing protein [Saprospiraceae bacterium]